MKNMPERVAVCGLDGLSWDYLNKISNYPSAQLLRYITKKSTRAVLEAEFPPVTLPSWTSILTGVNPGKHGIFAFDIVDLKSLRQRIYNAMDLMHPRIHEMLAFKNVKSVMINPIPSYPIIPVKNAYIISHMFMAGKTLFHPTSMEKFAQLLPKPPLPRRSNTFLTEYTNILESYVTLIENMIDLLDWKLFWINLTFPDEILHIFPEMLHKRIPYEDKMLNHIDKIIKTLLENADALFIVSDHGFSQYKYAISINDILLKLGVAKASTGKSYFLDFHNLLSGEEIRPAELKIAKLSLPLLRILYSSKLYSLRWKFLKPAYMYLPNTLKRLLLPTLYIDPSRSDAFMSSASSCGVYLRNESIKDMLISKIRKIRGILWVKERSEIYSGPYINRAPHILISPDYNRGFSIAGSKIYGQIIIRKDSCNHHPDGVFLCYSKHNHVLAQSVKRIKATMVTPIIMAIMNVPISASTDNISHLKSIIPDEYAQTSKEYLIKWQIARRSTLLKLKYR